MRYGQSRRSRCSTSGNKGESFVARQESFGAPGLSARLIQGSEFFLNVRYHVRDCRGQYQTEPSVSSSFFFSLFFFLFQSLCKPFPPPHVLPCLRCFQRHGRWSPAVVHSADQATVFCPEYQGR